MISPPFSTKKHLMIHQNYLKRLRRVVWGLVLLLIIFFLGGFLDFGAGSLLIIVLLYFGLGIVLNVSVVKSGAKGKLRLYLLLTGISSTVFSLGVTYGIVGIMGYYTINDFLYLSSVIIAFLAFVIGTICSLFWLNKGGS